jgi:hypothetical protein
VTTPHNSPHNGQQSGYGPGPYQTAGPQQGGPWPQADQPHAAAGAPGYGPQQGYGMQGYGAQPGAVQGYAQPGDMQGYAQPGDMQGYAQPGDAQGYGAQPGAMQGYAQPGAPQPGQGYPPQGQVPPGAVPPGQSPQGTVPPGQTPQGTAPPGQAPQGYGQPAYPYAPGYPDSYRSGLPGSGVGAAVAAAGKSVVKRIAFAVVGLAVIGGGGFIYNHLSGAPSTAEVGDCMAGNNENELKVVDCSDPSAQWTVTGKIENKTEVEFTLNRNICAQYQDTGSAYWEGERGKSGYVLCLKPRK